MQGEYLPQKIHLHFRMLSSPDTASGVLDINCCDPLGRSALLMAIDNENLEMVELLLENKVKHKQNEETFVFSVQNLP